jgi:hypothetical protein
MTNNTLQYKKIKSAKSKFIDWLDNSKTTILLFIEGHSDRFVPTVRKYNFSKKLFHNFLTTNTSECHIMTGM